MIGEFMYVRELLKKFLEENGYDGLFSTNIPCGCLIDDFIPCDGEILDCHAGYKVECKGNSCEADCEYKENSSWCISSEKEK
jgi:hypothetical protein